MSDQADTVRVFINTTVPPRLSAEAKALAALDALVAERDNLEHQRDVLVIYCDEEVERLIHIEAQSVMRVWDKVNEQTARAEAAEADRDRYAAALRHIAASSDPRPNPNTAAGIARAALKDET